MIERIYVEIGNICNLSCTFCPKTKRKARQMASTEFREICEKISHHTKNLYLHVMGEPLLHPELAEILDTVGEYGMRASITTNGTLIPKCEDTLLSKSDVIHKICISLHAVEGNDGENKIDEYLTAVSNFAKKASDKGIFTVLRLWNEESEWGKGKNSLNPYIEKRLSEAFTEQWQERPSGFRLMKYVFLEYAGVFEWPKDSTAKSEDEGRCHGLSDQIAILADGTVVPCCLDSEGCINLGNIFDTPLDEIVNSERARSMREGFSHGIITEELCKTCSYRRRFTR